MSYVIKAVLTSKDRPENGPITICFPIPAEDYDLTVEQLEQLGMGDALRRDCRVEETDSYYSVLKCLEGTQVNVDELNYLAKLLESFNGYEAAQFQATAYELGISNIQDLISLTFCSQRATVITDFSDLERIGRDHCMALNGGVMPTEQYQAIDGRKEALRLIRGGGGTVTPYGVVYDNGMVLEQCYNGRQFPAYLYDSPLLVLEVTPKQGLAAGEDPEYLYLPASERQIQRTLLRIGVTALYDTRMRLELAELPDITANALELDHLSGGDLPVLNRMCQAIALLQDTDMEKLNAVVLMTETSGAGSICRLAENLDQFDFISGIHTPEEYGRHMIQESGHFEYDENLEGLLRLPPLRGTAHPAGRRAVQ